MQIREIVLYNAAGEMRRLVLRPGEVNIITGGSKTGKSALQDIVEYCLGHDTCQVPEGVIWNTAAWYGLLLDFHSAQVFVARKHPGPGAKSNAQVYLEIGQDLKPRPYVDLRGTTSPNELVQQLTRLLGVSPNVQIPPEGQTRAALEANLKHALLLVFQGQSEIANRRFLFHRQGEPFIPQAIKDTLPYFLGAAPEDLLARHQELQTAERELKVALRQLEEAQRIAGIGSTRAYALLKEAEAAGLITRPEAEPDLEGILALLRSATEWRATAELLPTTAGTATDLAKEIEELGAKYGQLQDQISAAKQLAGEAQGFETEVDAQHARLQSIGLFEDGNHGTNRCPVCQSLLTEPPPPLAEMQRTLGRLRSQLAGVEADRPRLREMINGLQEEATELRRQLAEKRRAQVAIAAEDERFACQRDLDARRSYVVGRITLYLESSGTLDNRELRLLQQNAEEAQRKVDYLESRYAEVDVEEQLNSILNRIGDRMSKLAVPLQTEYSERPHRLDLKHLTVVADQAGGPVPMDRMGSAENWLACHLVAHLAIHQHFVEQQRPVPRFLFLDQPTQVYYPPERDAEGAIDELTDEDQAAVRRIYDLIFKYAAELAPRFQIVVTDHADLREERFQSAVVERWRGNKGLIPSGWIDARPAKS